MEILEAIRERHAVRKYQDRPIEAEKVEQIEQIEQLISECNRESGLHIQLVTNEPLAFSKGVFKYGQFSGVKNYLVLAGPKKSRSWRVDWVLTTTRMLPIWPVAVSWSASSTSS